MYLDRSSRLTLDRSDCLTKSWFVHCTQILAALCFTCLLQRVYALVIVCDSFIFDLRRVIFPAVHALSLLLSFRLISHSLSLSLSTSLPTFSLIFLSIRNLETCFGCWAEMKRLSSKRTIEKGRKRKKWGRGRIEDRRGSEKKGRGKKGYKKNTGEGTEKRETTKSMVVVGRLQRDAIKRRWQSLYRFRITR